jgi:nicotinate-nucleotide adenylyltransferase
VLFVVANDPWQKRDNRILTPAHHRMEMARLATHDVTGVEASDLEVRRGGPSYTIDTVQSLVADGDVEVVVIVGFDVAMGLDTWHRAAELRSQATIAVADRGGSTGELPRGWRIERYSNPQMEVSSTALRRKVRDGAPIEILVPGPVIDYIDQQGFYSGATW